MLTGLVACGPTVEVQDPAEGWGPADRPDLVAVVQVDGVVSPGSVVTLSPGSRDARQQDEGGVRFADLEPGTYVATVAHPLGETGTFVVDVVADTQVTWDLAPIPSGPTLSGTVRDAQGTPLSGARVFVDEVQVATTDLDGAFLIEDAGAGRHDLLVDAPGRRAGTWSTEVLDLPEHGEVEVFVDLPGAIPDTARPVGSVVCTTCHAEAGAAWAETAHAQAGRIPAELADHALAEGFVEGATVLLGDGVVASVGVDDGWWVELSGGGSSQRYDVVEVYGGHGPGAAFVGLDGGGRRVLLPVAWAAEGEGVHPSLSAGLVPAWTEGWVEDGTLDLEPDPATVSFDLRCAGCHTSGVALVDEGDGYALESFDGAPVEPFVGCESCHGDGSIHRRDASRRATNIVNPARMDGDGQVQVCARCHAATSSEDHPFARAPGWPVTSEGRLPQPGTLAEHATPDRHTLAGLGVSAVFADQAGDLAVSPHRTGDLGYEGSCSDCHVAHGSAHPADLRTEPLAHELCTDCHSELDRIAEQREHAGHSRYAPGLWSPGACITCHQPRTGAVVRRDPISGVGEQRAHTLWPGRPSQILVAFDEAATDHLEPGQVAVPGCLDCHAQADAILRENGLVFPGPLGDPYARQSYLGLAISYRRLWGVE